MKIEKNVPFPKIKGRHLNPKYPFREMKIGDSIYFGNYKDYRNALRASGKFVSRYYPDWVFRGKTSIETESGESHRTGRIWRIK